MTHPLVEIATTRDVLQFLNSANPGGMLIYSRGQNQLSKTSAVVMLRKAYNDGLIDFKQRRNPDRTLSYIAQLRFHRARVDAPFTPEHL